MADGSARRTARMNAGACAMYDRANCLMPADPVPYWEYGQCEGTLGS